MSFRGGRSLRTFAEWVDQRRFPIPAILRNDDRAA